MQGARQPAVSDVKVRALALCTRKVVWTGTTPLLFLRVVALVTCDIEREEMGKGREELCCCGEREFKFKHKMASGTLTFTCHKLSSTQPLILSPFLSKSILHRDCIDCPISLEIK